MVILSTALGASFYDKDRKKLRTISLLITLIDEIYTQMRFTGATVEEILLGCSDNPIYNQLTFLAYIKKEKGRFSHTMVKNAVQKSAADMNFDSEEMMPLLNLADKLGTTDIAGQLRLLDSCKLQLLELKSAQNNRCDTLGKMYITLGLLLGIGTAVILA